MKKIILLALAYAASAAFAATPGNDPAAYKSSMDKAAADYKTARAACDADKGSAKTICMKEAQAARVHAKADAVAQYKPTQRSVRNARTAAVNADYDVAKAKCADKSGNDRNACLGDAKSARMTAMADAKAGTQMAGTQTTDTQTTGTRTDANQNQMDAAQRSTATRPAMENCDRMMDASAKAACQARSKTGTASNVIADTVITTKVKADMIKDPDLKAMDVHVETVKGVVKLSGFVPSQAEAAKAVELARKVEGVTDVKSDLKVK